MRRLVDLDAFWIAPYGEEFALGVSWRCRKHARCFVFCWFLNPRGNAAPIGHVPGEVELYTRAEGSDSLESLTLLEPVNVRCWGGVLRDGVLLEH